MSIWMGPNELDTRSAALDDPPTDIDPDADESDKARYRAATEHPYAAPADGVLGRPFVRYN